LTDAAKGKASKKAGASSSPAPKRKHDTADEEDLVDDDLNVIRPATPERKSKKRSNRTPSTSPPPAPPDVEYMREGYTADDIYLMVEDEFLSTAKTYTQHIHHAEYIRLKKLAKSRGTGMLNAIARPTDGRTKQSNALRMKLEAEEKDRKIKNGMKKLGDGGDDQSSEAGDEYMYDPQLAGLMTRDNPIRKELSDLSKVKSNTRAAAGFTQSPHNAERKKNILAVDQDPFTEVSDDLDRAPPKTIKPSYTKATKPDRENSAPVAINGGVPKTAPERSGIFKRYTKPAVDENQEYATAFRRTSPTKLPKAKEAPTVSSRASEASDSHPTKSSASDYLTKRKLEKERKEREEKRKAKKADEIPTFLF
jgi:hypothetical protein